MKSATVDFSKCADAGCPICPAAKACDKRVLAKIDTDEPAFVDSNLCTACGDCITACPHSAIGLVNK